jgi:fructose-bisphosphate aldolase, class II
MHLEPGVFNGDPFMPLVSLLAAMPRIRSEHYAVALFPAFDMHGMEGMFCAAEELNSPVIVAMYSKLLAEPYARAMAAHIRARAKCSPVPVSLMLDHGGSFDECIRAISYGFSDLMFDGSSLSYEENIAHTREIVRAGHAAGIPVEAELGHVGMGSDHIDRMGFTDPDMVEPFVRATGIDALAVAIGNAHGLYTGTPHIDLELLAKIGQRVSVPLALHGGSGLSEVQFKAAIGLGIAKINIGTDLYVTTARTVNERAHDTQAGMMSYFDINQTVYNTFKERCLYYLDLFGGTGKSWTKVQ